MADRPKDLELVSVPHVGSFLDFTFESGRKVRVACHSVEEPAPAASNEEESDFAVGGSSLPQYNSEFGQIDESGFPESPKLKVVEGEVDESGFPQGKRQPPELGAPVAETVEGETKEPPADDKPVLKGKLPDDFPGKTALADADPPITTFAQLRKAKKDGAWTHLTGIGPATNTEIAAILEGVANSEEGSESQ